MPAPLDLAFALVVFVIVTIFETLVFFPRFKRAVEAGEPGARLRAYQRAAIGQWVFALFVLGLWVRTGRPWDQLGLVPPTDWRLFAGIAVVAIVTTLAVRQALKIVRAAPEKLPAVRPRLDKIAFMLPHDAKEHRWFLILSTTAGFCEELLYRGYLVWVLRPYIGVPGGLLAGVLLFGAGHLYQGRSGAIKATLAGLAMSIIVLATGWLIPAMIVHALIDASAGILGFRVLREHPPTGETEPRSSHSETASFLERRDAPAA
jgi:membrane protease YdiL (CAAX protease family)